MMSESFWRVSITSMDLLVLGRKDARSLMLSSVKRLSPALLTLRCGAVDFRHVRLLSSAAALEVCSGSCILIDMYQSSTLVPPVWSI